MPDLLEGSLSHCRDRAFYAYGTSRLFERRAQSLNKGRRAITFLGIAVPLVVGSTVAAFGTQSSLLPYLLGLAGIVGAVQLVLSAWSIVARWDERYAYSVAATQANTRLYNACDGLLR
jgi:mobilome CxxCx(11)CxxC protein